MKSPTLRMTLAMIVLVFATLLATSAAPEHGKATAGGEFFIISSVDSSKKQLVLKRPTEVTELMAVTDSTVFVDERGKPLQFKELRAGDTVYVASSVRRDGPPVALLIRRAPMTLEELHRRYLPPVRAQ